MIGIDYVAECSTDNIDKLVTSTNELCITSSTSIDYPTDTNYVIPNGNTNFKFVRTDSGIISIGGDVTGKK